VTPPPKDLEFPTILEFPASHYRLISQQRKNVSLPKFKLGHYPTIDFFDSSPAMGRKNKRTPQRQVVAGEFFWAYFSIDRKPGNAHNKPIYLYDPIQDLRSDWCFWGMWLRAGAPEVGLRRAELERD